MLINLRTDLKSLRYGNDTIGGGNSGQPYIQKAIPDSFNGLGASEDFILRGGINAVTDSLTDVRRLNKMFTDTKSPNGLLFIAKQQLLSRTAVRTQTSGVLNEGVYNPLSTLAQAGVVAFGGHLNKQGINPFAETGAYANNNALYNTRVKNYNQEWLNSPDGSLKNRLFALYESKIQNNEIGGFAKTNNISNSPIEILLYTGGPGSILGIGNTSIRFADQRTGNNNPLKIYNPNYFFGKNQQKSIDIDNKQVGGLQINVGNGTKTWIKGGVYFDGGAKNFYIIPNEFPNGLPSNNVNTPQSSSLDKIPNGEQTWTPKREQTKPDRILPLGLTTKAYIFENPEKNDPIFNSIVTGSFNYQLNRESSVYKSGSLNNTDLIYANNTYTYTQKQILENPYGNENTGETISSRSNVGKLNGSPIWQDFRKKIRETLGENSEQVKKAKEKGALPNSPNYAFKGIENRVNIGGQGGLGPGYFGNKNLSSYTAGSGIGPIDKINALPIYRSKNVETNSQDYPINDLVKFRIAVIDNNSPNFKTFIHFRAFIDSMSDSYNATWNGFNYLGRSEQFYNYGGFTRTVSLSWTVSAQSKQELIPMYKKLNYLASSLTGDYSPDGYMRGNLVQLTIGGYLYEQPGIITSLTYDVPTESPWEIGINDEGGFDSSVKELPHIIRVTGFNFIPIQNFVPQKQKLTFGDNNTTGSTDSSTGFVKTEGFQRYIALANGDDKDKSFTNYTNPS
jgi:hypothetical protein